VGLCDCSSECPEFTDCTCVYFHKKGECVCTCQGTLHEREVLKAEDEVNFSVRDTELGAVAEFVNQLAEAEVLIPASQMRNSVSVELEYVTFADALKEVGLVLGPGAPRPAGADG
jgi:hypothetical protein